MRKSLGTVLGLSALLVGTLAGSPAGAQSVDSVGPHNAYCGAWASGAWTPNGNCVEETTTTTVTTSAADQPAPRAIVDTVAASRVPQRVSGTIIAVRGHLVTLQQATHDLIVNDQPALNRDETGRVAVGRVVTAHGYWQDGTFYASRFDTTS
jgi:hypothetical protein